MSLDHRDLRGSSAGADQVRCSKENGHLWSIVQRLNRRWWRTGLSSHMPPLLHIKMKLFRRSF